MDFECFFFLAEGRFLEAKRDDKQGHSSLRVSKPRHFKALKDQRNAPNHNSSLMAEMDWTGLD